MFAFEMCLWYFECSALFCKRCEANFAFCVCNSWICVYNFEKRGKVLKMCVSSCKKNIFFVIAKSFLMHHVFIWCVGEFPSNTDKARKSYCVGWNNWHVHVCVCVCVCRFSHSLMLQSGMHPTGIPHPAIVPPSGKQEHDQYDRNIYT